MIRNGKAILADPGNYDAMAEIFWASSLSHNNLTECGRDKDFSVHKFGHALSAKYGVTHGASLAAVWGAWAEDLYLDCLPRFRRFAEKVWGITGDDDESVAREGIKRNVEYFAEIGMPTSLRGLGIDPSDDDLRFLALSTTANDTIKLSRIRPIGAAEAEKIFRKAR